MKNIQVNFFGGPQGFPRIILATMAQASHFSFFKLISCFWQEPVLNRCQETRMSLGIQAWQNKKNDENLHCLHFPEWCQNTVARQCWRHLVLLGLLGVLGCLWITKTRYHFQLPRKTWNGYVIIKTCVWGESINAISTYSVSHNLLQRAHVPPHATARTLKTFPNVCFHKIVIIAMHRITVRRVWNNIAAQSISEHVVVQTQWPWRLQARVPKNISDAIVLHTHLRKSCVRKEHASWDFGISGGGDVSSAANELRTHDNPELAEHKRNTPSQQYEQWHLSQRPRHGKWNIRQPDCAHIQRPAIPLTHHWPNHLSPPIQPLTKDPWAWQDSQDTSSNLPYKQTWKGMAIQCCNNPCNDVRPTWSASNQNNVCIEVRHPHLSWQHWTKQIESHIRHSRHA